MSEYRMLTIEEAATRLSLTVSEVEQLIGEGKIPVERRGRRVWVPKTDLDDWASQHVLTTGGTGLIRRRRPSATSTGRQPMLPELVGLRQVRASLPARTKASAIREMAALADQTGWVNDVAELIETLEAREELCSTAVPGGVAFPHPRTQDPYRFERAFIVVGRPVQPIHFGAPDGEPTDLFFLLCMRDEKLHLQLLARLCLLAQRVGVLEALRSAPDAEAMHDCLLAAERDALDSSGLPNC